MNMTVAELLEKLLAKNVLSNPAYVLFSEFSSGLETAIQDIYNL